MKNIDDLEWEKWDVIRRKGRFVYILGRTCWKQKELLLKELLITYRTI